MTSVSFCQRDLRQPQSWRSLLPLLMLWLALIASCQPVQAAPLAVNIEHPTTGSLGLHSQWLNETEGPLTQAQAQQLQAAGAFHQSDHQVLSFGINAAPSWLYLPLFNPQPLPVERQLVAGVTWTDRLELYLVDEHGQTFRWQSGDEEPGTPGLMPALGYTKSLTIPPGHSQLYIRAAGEDPMVLPLELTSAEQLQQQQLLKTFLYGLIYGFVLALCGYNLMLFIGIGERSHLYYALYLLSLMLCNVAYTGHGLMWLWPDALIVQRYIILLLMVLFTAFGLLFACRFLNLSSYLPRTLLAIRLFVITTFSLMAIWVAQGDQAAAATTAFWTVSLYSLLMCLLGLVMVVRYQASRYFLAATLFGGSGAAITAVTVWGIVPYSQLGYHAFEWGVVVEATLLALALAQQMRRYRRASEQAQYQASHDPLTRLLNRRGFLNAARPLWSTADRRHRPLTALMIDLDHFKSINDRFGHLAGDQALTAVAQLLDRQSREGDVLGRWGGEEFVVLMPETELADAARFAERLREGIATIAVANGNGLRLTASIGVAERSSGIPLGDLIAAADHQLYQAKKLGRNQVSIGNQQPEPDASTRPLDYSAAQK